MKKDTSKSTVLVISMGFLFIFLVFTWRWALISAFVIGMIGIVSSSLSKIIEKSWMQLAQVLGLIIPTILLGLVFFLILVPVSFLSKLFTKDPLMLSNNYKTYFVNINKEVEKKSFEKIW